MGLSSNTAYSHGNSDHLDHRPVSPIVREGSILSDNGSEVSHLPPNTQNEVTLQDVAVHQPQRSNPQAAAENGLRPSSMAVRTHSHYEPSNQPPTYTERAEKTLPAVPPPAAQQLEYQRAQHQQSQYPQYAARIPGMVLQLSQLGAQPAIVDCPRCHYQVMTRTNKEPGTQAFLCGAVICLICCPLAWIPCVMSDCMDTSHLCPQCNTELAKVSAGGGVVVSTSAKHWESQYTPHEQMVARPPQQAYHGQPEAPLYASGQRMAGAGGQQRGNANHEGQVYEMV